MTPSSRTAPTFAGCRIEAELGRGAMGVVYRATQLRLERPVALKVMAPELARDERFRQRFERESRLAASIDHPHVIPIYEADEEQGRTLGPWTTAALSSAGTSRPSGRQVGLAKRLAKHGLTRAVEGR
jgi:serine/threonine protein kinase